MHFLAKHRAWKKILISCQIMGNPYKTSLYILLRTSPRKFPFIITILTYISQFLFCRTWKPPFYSWEKPGPAFFCVCVDYSFSAISRQLLADDIFSRVGNSIKPFFFSPLQLWGYLLLSSASLIVRRRKGKIGQKCALSERCSHFRFLSPDWKIHSTPNSFRLCIPITDAVENTQFRSWNRKYSSGSTLQTFSISVCV